MLKRLKSGNEDAGLEVTLKYSNGEPIEFGIYPHLGISLWLDLVKYSQISNISFFNIAIV